MQFLRNSILVIGVCSALSSSAQEQMKYTVDRTIPLEFLGTTVPFVAFDQTQRFRDERVRDEHGLIGENEEAEEELEGRRGNPVIVDDPLPHGVDPAWQTAAPLHGFDRAVDLSVNGQGNTGVSPADPCLEVGPNHVIQMINGSSGAYFRIFNKSLTALGVQTYLDNFTGSVGGAGDPIVLYDAMADRWLMSEFSASGNKLLVAISQTSDPLGSWYAYSYQATNFPDYPKYAVWNNCYVVTTNEATPAIYVLPRASMLTGSAGTVVRFAVSSYGTIAFQSTTPVTYDGGTAPPAGAPAMFMRMADAAWGAPADRLEIWNINYNVATPASSTITGPTFLTTDAFDSGLCGYTTLNCITQPGTQTMDPLRELLMNRICYRNISGYEAIVCTHAVDVNTTDRAGLRWYELHRTGGYTNPWSIYQQGTYSPDANDRWMPTIAINENGDIGLAYNIAGTVGGNIYPSVRYTGRYKNDPLGQMTFAETSIVAGSASHNNNRYGDYNSLDVDPSDGLSFYGTAMYNPAAAWSTRMFKFSFPVVGCTAPTVSENLADNCGAGTFTLSVTIGANGDAVNYDVYTSVNGASQTFNSTRTPGTYVVGTYGFGTNVAVQVRHNGNAACNQTLTAVTSNGTSCCTAPTAVVTGTCIGTTNYSVSVNLASLGSATSIDIQIDPDAGGPSVPVTVQTVTAPGSYGPYGNYTSGSPVNVTLVHNLFAQCNFTQSNFVKNCNAPGAGCGAFTNNTSTAIADNATTTSTIVVPSQSGATITDLNVYVNITHTYVSDLRLSLRSPTNTTVNLISVGLCTDNDNIIVEFDQTGVNGAVGTTCPMNNLYVIPAASLAGFNGQLLEGTWTLTVQDVVAQDVGTINSWCLIPTLAPTTIQVSPKVMLEGPYNTGTGLMSDALRSSSLLPNTQPYTALGYTFTGSPGAGGTVASSVFTVTGSNAIVDWVIVELRSASVPSTIIASCAALVQSDGDVVALDGISPVTITAPPNSYYVAVRHRNHLGCMSATAAALTNVPVTINFSAPATATYGTDAQTTVGTVKALRTGDVSFNRTLSYTGAGNDRDPILVRVGSTTPNNTVNGYYIEDTNMNGIVSYTGGANDRDVILVNVGSTTPNNTRVEQIP
jgi:subtilisin-like proprotein convertase family protein